MVLHSNTAQIFTIPKKWRTTTRAASHQNSILHRAILHPTNGRPSFCVDFAIIRFSRDSLVRNPGVRHTEIHFVCDRGYTVVDPDTQ